MSSQPLAWSRREIKIGCPPFTPDRICWQYIHQSLHIDKLGSFLLPSKEETGNTCIQLVRLARLPQSY